MTASGLSAPAGHWQRREATVRHLPAPRPTPRPPDTSQSRPSLKPQPSHGRTSGCPRAVQERKSLRHIWRSCGPPRAGGGAGHLTRPEVVPDDVTGRVLLPHRASLRFAARHGEEKALRSFTHIPSVARRLHLPVTDREREVANVWPATRGWSAPRGSTSTEHATRPRQRTSHQRPVMATTSTVSSA